MFRIYLYLAIYILTLIFFILSGFNKSFEGIIFLIFLVATLGYTFSREGLPGKDVISYPQTFRYRARRMNIYGYGMATTLVISSIVIGYISTLSFISTATTVLVLWPIIALISYSLSIINARREEIYPLYEYIVEKLGFEIDFNLCSWIINNANSEDDLMRVPGTFAKYNIQILRETYKLKKSYIESAKSTVSFEEIQAAQEKKATKL